MVHNIFHYPWTKTSLSIALTLTAIPVLTQLAIFPSLFRNQKMVLLCILLLMFTAAQVFWAIWAIVTFMMYTKMTSYSNHTELVGNAVATIFYGLNNILYCTAHWIYVMKCWVISLKIANTQENKPHSERF